MNPSRRVRRNRVFLRYLLPLVIVVAGVALAVKYGASIWLTSQRAQLEQTIGKATGLQTRIAGSISATLLPTPGISLGDITLGSEDRPVLYAKELQTSFALKPLFDKRFIPGAFSIEQARLQLVADEKGIPQFALPPAPPTPSDPALESGFRFELPDKLELRDSHIIVRSESGAEVYSLQGLNLAIHPLRHKALILKSREEGSQENWALAIYLNFSKAKIGQLVLGPTQVTAQYQPNHLSAGINRAEVFGGLAQGTLSWSTETPDPEIRTSFTLTDFNASDSVTLFQPDSFINGKLTVTADLASSGQDIKSLVARSRGTVKLSGSNLDLVTMNLDELVTRIINAQNYNLVDAAAYFFIGPFGASATKGMDIANVAKELGKAGNTPNQIKRLTSSWRVADGIATAEDVALETNRYRLALKGKVHLLKREFDNLRIAVVDDHGCAIASQRLDGPIASPRIEKTNLLLTLTRPMLDALAKSAKRLTAGNCEPFYKGELLPQPVASETIEGKESGNTAPQATQANEENQEQD